jgi:TrmH family RNA methyltransferase
LACTARTRSLPLPGRPPRQAAEAAVTEVLDHGHQVAIVFGRERSGLTTEEAQLSNALVHIPTSDAYRSLNLAQAVQILSYEIRMAALGRSDQAPVEQPPSDWVPEPLERLDHFFVRLEDGLQAINFLNPAQPKRLMQRLRRLFIRARPDENELNILNGIVSSMIDIASRNREASQSEKVETQ